ncbi:MAG: DNA primase [Planctomycetota bacterium]
MPSFEQIKSQILDRVNLLDVVSEHTALKRNGRRWVGLCCFHQEKTPSFSVNPEQGLFHCFGCGQGGDLFSFVQLRERVPFVDAMRMLADRAGVKWEVTSAHSRSSGPERTEVISSNEWAAAFFRRTLLDERIGRAAREYLRNRSVSDDMSEKFSLGVACEGSESLPGLARKAGFREEVLIEADLRRKSERGDCYDTFRDRLMFPIRDASGRVIGFGGRTLSDHTAKYINTRQNVLFDKGRSLYGLDIARNRIVETGRVVVVEGYLDVIACHQAGATETVATLGTALTTSHVELLRRYCDTAIVLFDSDQAGQAAAERAIKLALPSCLRVRLARIPDGKDPSDFLGKHSPEAFLDVLNTAIDALEFQWLQTLTCFGGSDSDARRREAVLDFIGIVAEAYESGSLDAIQRGLLINQVAHLLRLSAEEVQTLLKGRSARKRGPEASGHGTQKAVDTRKPAVYEQAAWERLLGAALNEPGLLTLIGNFPDVDRIADERDRRIAKVIQAAAGEKGEFVLRDILLRCEDVEDASRVTALLWEGEKRGQFAETYTSAKSSIVRFTQAARDIGSAKVTAELLVAVDDESARSDVRVAQEGLMKHRHFAPRRILRRVAGDGVMDPKNVDRP